MRPEDCTNCRVQPLDHYAGALCPMCGHPIKEA